MAHRDCDVLEGNFHAPPKLESMQNCILEACSAIFPTQIQAVNPNPGIITQLLCHVCSWSTALLNRHHERSAILKTLVLSGAGGCLGVKLKNAFTTSGSAKFAAIISEVSSSTPYPTSSSAESSAPSKMP